MMNIHIVNNTHIEYLAQKYFPDDQVVRDGDVLNVGPLAPNLDDYRSARKLFFDEYYLSPLPDTAFWSAEFARTMPDVRRICFWLTNSLNDQLAACLWATRLKFLGIAGTDVDVIVTGSTTNALRSASLCKDLLPDWVLARRPLSSNEWAALQDWWVAITNPTPNMFLRLLSIQTSHGVVPLRDSLRLLLGRYPDSRTGLSVWEDILLHHIASKQDSSITGPRLISEVVCGLSDKIDQPGDLTLLQVLLRMDQVATSFPLVQSFERDGPFRRTKYSLTALGRAVLHGQENYLAYRPIDRWVGGVHLNKGNVWVREGDGLVLWP